MTHRTRKYVFALPLLVLAAAGCHLLPEPEPTIAGLGHTEGTVGGVDAYDEILLDADEFLLVSCTADPGISVTHDPPGPGPAAPVACNGVNFPAKDGSRLRFTSPFPGTDYAIDVIVNCGC
jgi:hypothetical protein